jgi:hypothetical protein
MYPQRFAELMAVDIPVSRDTEREPSSFDQIRLGHRSAAEMGWISQDQADSFYRGLGTTPDQQLEGGEEEGDAAAATAP